MATGLGGTETSIYSGLRSDGLRAELPLLLVVGCIGLADLVSAGELSQVVTMTEN